MCLPSKNSPLENHTSAQTRMVHTDRAHPATRKPFVPPMLKTHGTLSIQAGSINLWDKK